MARIAITIETGNAAFCDPETGEESGHYAAEEVARIIRSIADRMLTESTIEVPAPFDWNGNRATTITVES